MRYGRETPSFIGLLLPRNVPKDFKTSSYLETFKNKIKTLAPKRKILKKDHNAEAVIRRCSAKKILA